ncbi:hypothetical protein [Streptomyces chartreusis]|uniref:hypothetical protein n=1 Tax=Streptomyces chartreusis TaxID=1969 RepID=UPI0036309D4A
MSHQHGDGGAMAGHFSASFHAEAGHQGGCHIGYCVVGDQPLEVRVLPQFDFVEQFVDLDVARLAQPAGAHRGEQAHLDVSTSGFGQPDVWPM